MNMQEMSRFIQGLRSAGWSEKQINDFIVYIESGDDNYKPTAANNTAADKKTTTKTATKTTAKTTAKKSSKKS